LLNISPMPDGTIPQQQKDLLSAFGSFLKQFGSAIYNTRAWMVYGEGPTKIGGGSFSGPVAGTASDVRYTASKDGDAVYAILLGWPGNGQQVTLASVTPARFTVGSGKVYLFGPVGGQAINLAFTQDTSGLHVTLPSTQPYTAIAYAMKISKSGTLPAPTPMINNGSTTPPEVDGGVPDGGGSAGAGGNGGRGGAGGSGTGGRGGGGGGGGIAGGTGGAGASGLAGTTGTAGRGGAGGSAGAGGTSGSAGTSGTAGAAGVAGSVGAAGTTGRAGTSGSAGTTGAAGSSASGSAGSGGPGLTDATGGCTCALADRRAGTETWIGALLAPLALMVARRRRRRR
jgi:hypothetical protein